MVESLKQKKIEIEPRTKLNHNIYSTIFNTFLFSFTEDEKFELCVINPGFILGPVLIGSTCTSMEV